MSKTYRANDEENLRKQRKKSKERRKTRKEKKWKSIEEIV